MRATQDTTGAHPGLVRELASVLLILMPLLAWLLSHHSQQWRHAAIAAAALVWTVVTVCLLPLALGNPGLL